MKDEFSIKSVDFMFLYELIRRPFFGPHIPGGLGGGILPSKTRKNRGRRIHTRKNRRY